MRSDLFSVIDESDLLHIRTHGSHTMDFITGVALGPPVDFFGVVRSPILLVLIMYPSYLVITQQQPCPIKRTFRV